MKKIKSILLLFVCLFAFQMPTLAEDERECYSFTIVNNSGFDLHDISIFMDEHSDYLCGKNGEYGCGGGFRVPVYKGANGDGRLSIKCGETVVGAVCAKPSQCCQIITGPPGVMMIFLSLQGKTPCGSTITSKSQVIAQKASGTHVFDRASIIEKPPTTHPVLHETPCGSIDKKLVLTSSFGWGTCVDRITWTMNANGTEATHTVAADKKSITITPGTKPGKVTVKLDGDISQGCPITETFEIELIKAEIILDKEATKRSDGKFERKVFVDDPRVFGGSYEISVIGSGISMADDGRKDVVVFENVVGKGSIIATGSDGGKLCREVQFGCGGCLDCPVGTGSTESGSVLIKMSTAKFQWGEEVGTFLINTLEPANIASPSLLKFFGTRGPTLDGRTNHVIKTAGIINQVKFPYGDNKYGLADVNVVDSTTYTLSFYKHDQFNGTLSGGEYPVNGGMVAYAKWKIDNISEPASAYTDFEVTEFSEGVTVRISRYKYNASNGDWTLDTGITPADSDWKKKEIRRKTVDGQFTYKTYEVWGRDINNVAIKQYVSREKYSNFGLFGKERLLEFVEDPDGIALTTTYTYYEDTSLPGRYGKVLSVVYPSGRWEKFEYDKFGRRTFSLSQYLNEAMPSNSVPGSSLWTWIRYNPEPPRETRTIVARSEIELSRGWVLKFGDVVETVTGVVPGPNLDSNYPLTNRVVYYSQTDPNPYARGKIMRENHTDDTWSFFSYGTNSLNQLIVTNDVGVRDAALPKIIDGFRTVSKSNRDGNVVVLQKYAITGPDTSDSSPTDLKEILAESFDVTAFDMGRPTTISYLNGTTELKSYSCCGLDSFTDRNGTVTTYLHDPHGFKRVWQTTKAGVTIQEDFDALGNVTKRTRISGATQVVLEENTYDLVGRLKSTKQPSNTSNSSAQRTTNFAEKMRNSNYGNQHTKITVYPDTSTRVEIYYQSGKLKEVQGTAVSPVSYRYGVDPKKGEWTQVRRKASATSVEQVDTTYSDAAGRPYLQESTRPSGLASTTTSYNKLGLRSKVVDPDGVTTFYRYDGRARISQVVQDANRNGKIDPFVSTGQADRITTNLYSIVIKNTGNTVFRTTTQEYANHSDQSTVTVQIDETAFGGKARWLTQYGRTTKIETLIKSPGVVETTTTLPDGSTNVTERVNGFTTKEQRFQSNGTVILEIEYTPDLFNRIQTIIDRRVDKTTQYEYYADDSVREVSVSDAESTETLVTQYEYDAMGRVTKVFAPGEADPVITEYYPNGTIKKKSGPQTYPVEYTYDLQGRMRTMKTWRNANEQASADLTIWKYNALSGFLESKIYADNKEDRFTYYLSGRLATKTPIGSSPNNVIRYVYSNLGELKAINHGDDTTLEVNYVFDRRGRKTTITDETGLSTVEYTDDGQIDTQTFSVSSSGRGFLNGFKIKNQFDTLGRRENMYVKYSATGTDYSTLFTHTYAYDESSRLKTVTRTADSESYSADYTYHPKSSLPDELTFTTPFPFQPFQLSKDYDGFDRIESWSWANNALIGLYTSGSFTGTLQYNNKGQREKVFLGDTYWSLGYDAKGQLTSAKRRWNSGYDPVAGQQFEYSFDDIGNRNATESGGNGSGQGLRTSSYDANNLNQYVSRTVPGKFDVVGVASLAASVSLRVQAGADDGIVRTERRGAYFRGEATVDNSAGPVFADVDVQSYINDGQNADIERIQSGELVIPPATQAFLHDERGNLRDDGVTRFTWDPENRLRTFSTIQSVTPPGKRKKGGYVYDHLGRRIFKQVVSENGDGTYSTTERYYLYDGWNLIAEIDAADKSIVRSFTWGTDLSGTMQGAGGVGGLLMVTQGASGGTCFVGHDHNGNVTELVNSSGGIVGSYEYGPFGEVIRASGPNASLNPFRFSTKYTDEETDLVYYGYRYYSPSIGRWLSRDPIAEQGGLNLYSFVGNDGVNNVDILGRITWGWPVIAPPGYQPTFPPMPNPSAPGIPIPRPATERERATILYMFGLSPLAEMLLNRYMDASGDQVTLSESEMVAAKAFIDLRRSDAMRTYVALLRSGPYQKVELSESRIALVANEPVTLRGFTGFFRGELTDCGGGGENWEFNGTIRFYDNYDFNPHPWNIGIGPKPDHARDPSAEAQTRFANFFITGKEFPVYSVSVPISQKSKDFEATWAGKGNGGPVHKAPR